MIRFVRAVACWAVFAGVSLVAHRIQAAPFQNLDFEQAQVIVNDPIFGHLDWELALPGWIPDSGDPSSATVYYGSGHLGDAGLIMLAGADSPLFGSGQIAGDYSLIVRGGADPEWPNDQSLSQVGDVPLAARAIELLVAGDPPILSLNGQQIPLFKVDDLGSVARYAGNVTSFAGTSAELRILYPQSTTWRPPTEFEGPMLDPNSGIIDNIEFTTRIVPEPATGLLALIGVAGIFWARLQITNKARSH